MYKMAKALIFIILSLLCSIRASDDILDCGEHCIECDIIENITQCSKCEDNYYWSFEKNSCIQCNDYFYRCEGKCYRANYYDLFALCEEGGCSYGYINLNGICISCHSLSIGCSKCSYEMEKDNSDEGNFTCYRCDSYYGALTKKGTCEHCKIPGCDSCYFNSENQPICNQCSNGYYKKYGECNKCRRINIEGGYCNLCSYDYRECFCDIQYSLTEYSECIKCDDGCEECVYNNIANESICIKCLPHYVLNKNQKCIYCGDECTYCELNENNNIPTCLSCKSGIMLSNNKCIPSISGCKNQIIEQNSENKDELVCNECNYDFYSISNYKNCTYCKNEDVGEGCKRCYYNQNNNKYECLKCLNDSYAYITNTFQCFSNNGQNDTYLYGCLKANYNENLGRYECFECKENFMIIKGENICRNIAEINLSLDCLEITNIGTTENPIYSCDECNSNFSLIALQINSTYIKDCYNRNKNNNLSYCLSGEIDENGNFICDKCVENAIMNDNSICKCNSGYFGKNSQWCYKCDDELYGNPGCNADEGCKYIHITNEINCNECIEGYFEYSKGKCYDCKYIFPYCKKCYIDKYNKFHCESCIDNYVLNNENNKCEPKECKEYPEISPGCIICKNRFYNYYNNYRCQSCKNGYFKTREETCIYCRSEKYGGPGCYECQYENDTSDNIICKDCFSIEKYDDSYNPILSLYLYNSVYHYNSLLSNNKKCYITRFYDSDTCLKYDFIKDNNNNEKLFCAICRPDFILILMENVKALLII